MEKEEIIKANRDQTFYELPLELWHHILEYCSITDLLQLRFINNQLGSKASDLLRKTLGTFRSEIESHINKYPRMVKLHENRRVSEFDPFLKEYFCSSGYPQLWLLALIVSDDIMKLLETRYPLRDNPWVPYNENKIRVSVRVPLSLRFGYFSTMSIMHCVAGYLLMFDTSDIDSFWAVFRWIDYIIKEKAAATEHPLHYVIIAFVFADKQRAVHRFQAEYFAQVMGMTYIEVDAADPTDLNKVWPQMLNLFSTDDTESASEEKPAKKKKKSQPCKTQ